MEQQKIWLQISVAQFWQLCWCCVGSSCLDRRERITFEPLSQKPDVCALHSMSILSSSKSKESSFNWIPHSDCWKLILNCHVGSWKCFHLCKCSFTCAPNSCLCIWLWTWQPCSAACCITCDCAVDNHDWTVVVFSVSFIGRPLLSVVCGDTCGHRLSVVTCVNVQTFPLSADVGVWLHG